MPAEAATSGSSVYFSPGKDPLNAIITQIQNARELLEICVFTISDDRITKAILDRHRFNTPIRVITDNDKLHDAGSDITALAESGVDVRVDTTPNHMHHKFAVIDSETLLTGYYNWTRSAATRNEENLLVTQEKAIIVQYQQEFRALWKRSDPF
jgi:phosphatidylserine/phosphatidylglycerophosphate/cardiolipin synthase-like enzyme